MRLVKSSGFSLLELMLALSISSLTLLAAMQIFTQMWAHARIGQQRSDAVQNFYQLGHWSVRALLLAQKADPTSPLELRTNCIIMGTIGLRVRNQQLQWRPEEGDCESNGWHGLHDPSHLRIDGIQLQSQQFCLQGRYRRDTVLWQWCHPWYP